MSKGQLTIQLTSREGTISVSSFLSAIGSAVDLLQEIDAAMSRKRQGTINWSIAAASMGSPLCMTIEGVSETEDDMAPEVIRHAIEGLRQLEDNIQAAPMYFTEEALECAKKLVSGLNDGIQAIRLSAVDIEPVTPTQRVAASVDELLRGEHEEWGTVVGALETLTIHGRTCFSIWDEITGRRIECFIPRERWDEVYRAFGKRVAVHGLIQYDRLGKPAKIHVRDLRVKRGWDNMVRAADLPPIDITRGVEPSEYVRRIWNGD